MNWKRVDSMGNVEDVTVLEDCGSEVVIQYLLRENVLAKRKVAKETVKQNYCKDDVEVQAWLQHCKTQRIMFLKLRVQSLRQQLEEVEKEYAQLTGGTG